MTQSRWEPFILGILASVLHNEDVQEIGVKLVGAWPDELHPHMIVCIDRQFYSDDDGTRPQYRITVERVP